MRRWLKFPLLLFALGMTLVYAKEDVGRRKPVSRPPSSIHVTIRPDCSLELTWKKCRGPVCLERKLPSDELFMPLREFSTEERYYTDSTNAPNTLVLYRLRPVNAKYLTEFGPVASVYIPLPSPPQPLLTRVSIDSVKVELLKRSSLTDTVIVERKIHGMFTRVGTIASNQSDFRDGGLVAGQYQYYRLRFQNGERESSPSAGDSIPLSLPPPSDLAAKMLDDHTVQLSWRPALPYSCIYEVETRAPDGVQLSQTASGDTLWNDTELGYEQATYYRVRTTAGSQFSDFAQPVSAYYSLGPADSLRMDPVHDLCVHLSWQHSDSLAAAFLVERSRDSSNFDTLARMNGRSFAYSDTLRERGDRLFYRIVAVAGNGTTASSETVTERIPFLEEGMAEVPSDSVHPGFWIDALEVSVAQYLEFCRETGRQLPQDPGFTLYPAYWLRQRNHPAVNVSWNDAVDFCDWRSTSVGLIPAYNAAGRPIRGANGYRLPNREQFVRALCTVADTMAILADINDARACPVASDSFQTQAALVHNLIGNVWEWNEDAIADSARLILGGAYCTPRKLAGNLPEFCYRPDFTSPTIGFRCVLPKSATGTADPPSPH